MQIELFRDEYRLNEKVSPKARNIRLEVRPGGEVVLIYPRFVPRIEALAFLRSREGWIRQKLAELAQRQESLPKPQPTRWDGSDRIPVRGVETPVQRVSASLKQITVRIESGLISLFCPPARLGEHTKLEQALRRELQHLARAEAQKYLTTEAARLGVSVGDVRINDPKTLWGSCNPTGTICLSWRLVMAPPEVFRYVVVHELCHLVHRNHSARFWALVERQFPDYEVHKRWLREYGGGLHLRLPVKTSEEVTDV